MHTFDLGIRCSCFSLIFYPNLTKQNAFALDLKEEHKKEKLAKYTFNFSSPYFTSNYKTTPHAHMEIKRLVEEYTKNNVYVKIHDGGINGIGTILSNKVRFGFSQGALLSVSNLTPMVKELDVLNIPFWSSNESEYIRLFNSQAWNKYVLSKTKKYNLHVLFPYIVGARTATTTKKYKKLIKSPEDFVDVRFRVPGSNCLAIFYELAKAKPVNIAWKNCAKTARSGRFQALDPSIAGLYAGPDNLRDQIGIISEIESVHDGWVAIGNIDFIESLDHKTRIQFLDAFKEIQDVQLQLFKGSKAYCIKKFEKLGVKIYVPTKEEKEVLVKAFGHQHPAWNSIKKKLLGDNGMAIFDELYKIAKG